MTYYSLLSLLEACPALNSMHCVCLQPLEPALLALAEAQTFATGEPHANEPLDY